MMKTKPNEISLASKHGDGPTPMLAEKEPRESYPQIHLRGEQVAAFKKLDPDFVIGDTFEVPLRLKLVSHSVDGQERMTFDVCAICADEVEKREDEPEKPKKDRSEKMAETMEGSDY